MDDSKEFLGTEPRNKLLFKLAVPTVAAQLTFVSIGNAPCSIIVAVVRKFVLLIPLIYILPQLIENQAYGVYLAEPVADAIAVIVTSSLFYIQFRKALRSIDKQNP